MAARLLLRASGSAIPLALLLPLLAAPTSSSGCDPCECTPTSDGGLRADCEGQHISDIPTALPDDVKTLRLHGTRVTILRSDALRKYRQLTHLTIHGDEALREVQTGVFDSNAELHVLYITLCTNLTHIEAGVFAHFRLLRYIHLESNGLVELPDFSAFANQDSTPVEIDLDHNKISRIRSRALCQPRAEDASCSPPTIYGLLSLRNNSLEEIEEFAFAGANISHLDFSLNLKLSKIDENAFGGSRSLKNLSLSGTAITKLPTAGLEELLELNLESTPSLTLLPPTVRYIKVETVRVSYPQHCCAFKYPKIQDKEVYEQVKRKKEALHCSKVAGLSTSDLDSRQTVELATDPSSTGFSGNWNSDGDFLSRRLLSISAHQGIFGAFYPGGVWGDIKTPKPSDQTTLDSPGNWHHEIPSTPSSATEGKPSPTADDGGGDRCSDAAWNLDLRRMRIDCTPEPNAFNPCIDVLEADWLRCVTWAAALLAALGNAAVLLLTLFVKAPLTVTKFLVCNLVLADLFLGTYLIALAAEDARTTGGYFNHALSWQYGGACDAVGFLAVFGAELSVFTLVVITLERWYTISNAIQLTKRIKMRHAVCIMCGGWLFCFLIAVAPTVGASSYQVTSLCLPFRYESAVDKGYVILLLGVNMAAFVVVLACYASMYAQVRHSSCLVNKSDTEVARRMAYLVAIDFLCWGPVAIIAALSAGGVDINVPRLSGSSLTHAKIVLALFFPINALANPFLYAILTRQFQSDVVSTFYHWGICQKEFMSYAMDTFGQSNLGAGRGMRSSCTRLAVTKSAPESLATESTHMHYTSELQRRGSGSGSERRGSGRDNSTPHGLPTLLVGLDASSSCRGLPTHCCSSSTSCSSSSSSSSEPRLDAVAGDRPGCCCHCHRGFATEDVSSITRLLDVYATLSSHGRRHGGSACSSSSCCCCCAHCRSDGHTRSSGPDLRLAAGAEEAAAAAEAATSWEAASCCRYSYDSGDPCRQATATDCSGLTVAASVQQWQQLTLGSNKVVWLGRSQPGPQDESQALLDVESRDFAVRSPCQVPAFDSADGCSCPAKGWPRGSASCGSSSSRVDVAGTSARMQAVQATATDG